MSIRTKVLVFAGVALALISSSGAVLYQSASKAQEMRLQRAALDSRLELYSELQHQAWRYLGRLLQAGRVGNDTRTLLHEHEQFLTETRDKLLEALRAQQQPTSAPVDAREAQLVDAVIEAQRRWAEGVEVVLRPAATGATPEFQEWWELFSTYEQEVSPQLGSAMALTRGEQQQLHARADTTVQRVQWFGCLAPFGACLLLGLLGANLLVPLLRELRQLRGENEQLRASVREKERLLEATADAAQQERRREVETAARDLHRYNTALEQMVRARTAELESANAQLASSLRQLQTMQAQLMFTDRLASMGRLAAGVGHEINNPLAFVISNLNYVHKELHRTQGAPSEEDRRELLTAVSEAKEGAERVRVIVQDLKTLARPDDAGSGKADLKEVLRAAVKIASHEIRRRARLVEELEDVPPVLGNTSRLGQVFLNLLINAAQAIPEGHVGQNEIRISARQEASSLVVVEISDTGCGIPEENLDRIFDPFFTTKPVGEGTGLGLSLVHSIVTAVGGTITVKSQPDQGTTFRVSLPSAQALS